jgi:GTP-binding protein Era
VPIVEAVAALGDWREIFPISATTGTNVEPLLESVVQLLPFGPRYFPEGTITDYRSR